MAFSPQIFYSNAIQHAGFAKPSRFRVILNMPPGVINQISKSTYESFIEGLDTATSATLNTVNGFIGNLFGNAGTGQGVPALNSTVSRYLAMQCESTELPGRSVLTNDIDIYGPVFKRPYKTAYSEIPFTFICTNDFYERRLFDTWMETMLPTDTHNARYSRNVDGQRQYTTDVAIIQYDEFVKQIYAVKLIDAFPISVAPMPLSWGEDGFHRLTTQFAYTKYEVITNLQYDFPNASDIFGAIGTRILGGINIR